MRIACGNVPRSRRSASCFHAAASHGASVICCVSRNAVITRRTHVSTRFERLAGIDHAKPFRIGGGAFAIGFAHAFEKVRIFHFYTIGLTAAVRALHAFGDGKIEQQRQIRFHDRPPPRFRDR